MAAPDPLLHGPLAAHPLAAAFAAEVQRVHRRYASEIVEAHRLCPHLHDVDKDFGTFVVMLDSSPEPSVEATVEAVHRAASPVIHVIFPLVAPPPSAFERFAGKVSQAMKRAFPKPPVMATFHPELVGDANDPHRMIGLIRRAPDPFVQMIPDGYQDGGTKFSPLPAPGEAPVSEADKIEWSQRNYNKLRGEALDRLLARISDIRADRDRSYAPFVEALARPFAARSASSGMT